MKRARGPSVESLLVKLRQAGVKITPNRRKVLDCFLSAEKPWTLSSLHVTLGKSGDSELSSIYRALEAFRQAGLLEEFRFPGDRQTYFSLIRHADGGQPLAHGDSAHQHHHHHIVCQDCGTVSHLDMCVPAGWMGKVERASGFQITEHHLEFKGICGECR